MLFTWDQRKSEQNRLLRGFDFFLAARIFDGFVVRRPDDRRDYGELRIVALGRVGDRSLTVVYTDRRAPSGELECRIISARQSNIEERLTYAQAIAQEA